MRYLVAEGAIGPNGRTVRCAHCGHQWFEQAEEGLDEELFAAEAPFEDLPEDDEAFEITAPPKAYEPDNDDRDFQSILQKELESTPIPAGVIPLHDHDDVTLPKKPDRKKMKLSGEQLAGFATAGGIFAVAFIVFLLMHSTISRAWPPSNLLYNLVGMKPIMPGEGLSLEGLTAKMENGQIVMGGIIVNLKDEEVAVPSVVATIVDQKEQPIEHVLIAPPVARLKVEGQANFDATYPKMPDGATNVTYAFSFIKAEPSPEVATPADAPTMETPDEQTPANSDEQTSDTP